MSPVTIKFQLPYTFLKLTKYVMCSGQFIREELFMKIMCLPVSGMGDSLLSNEEPSALLKLMPSLFKNCSPLMVPESSGSYL